MKKHVTEQTAIFFSVSKWMILSSFVGIIIGGVITLFLKILQFSENSRDIFPFHYYYFLPLAFLLTVWIVKNFAPSAEGHGTEKVIESVHKNNAKINISVIPVKLLVTVLTIFAGGSVGKEGPAAQIGAGVGSFISDIFKFSNSDRKKIVICGISAGFATVFGTPIAGAIFGIEVLVIGVIMYDVLLPSFVAGFAAFTTAQFLGIEYTYYDVRFYQSVTLDLLLILKVILAGVFFGIVSYILITVVSKTHKIVKKSPINPYVKAIIGGIVLIVLVYIFGERYIGLGLDTIREALDPKYGEELDLPWYTFLIKTIFTSISLGVGGSGGIITPIFYIGATSGHTFGELFAPENIELFAALGFVSVVAATTNAPIAATIMAVELFGIEIAHYASISAVISFLISGHRSIFSSQILAMKKSEMLKLNIGEAIDKTEVDLEDREIDKIRKMRERLHDKSKNTRKKNKVDKGI